MFVVVALHGSGTVRCRVVGEQRRIRDSPTLTTMSYQAVRADFGVGALIIFEMIQRLALAVLVVADIDAPKRERLLRDRCATRRQAVVAC